jgi:hypothetical protein
MGLKTSPYRGPGNVASVPRKISLTVSKDDVPLISLASLSG